MEEADKGADNTNNEAPSLQPLRPWQIKKPTIADAIRRREKEINGYAEDFMEELKKV